MLFGVALMSLLDDGCGRLVGPGWLVGLGLVGEAMVEQARVRCSVCRSAVAVEVLWAVGETCPHCSQPLYAARRRPNPPGVLGRTIAVLHAESPARIVRPREDKQ